MDDVVIARTRLEYAVFRYLFDLPVGERNAKLVHIAEMDCALADELRVLLVYADVEMGRGDTT